MQRVYVIILIIFVFSHVSNAQIKWAVKKPFEQKDFVENVGQFNLDKNFPNQKILYSIRTQGIYYFLTDKGIIFSKYIVTHSENETSKENEEEGFELENKFTFLEWSNINPSVNTVKQREVANYYTYYTSEKGSIKASAYKEIIYQDIYKNIDLKFETLADSGGLKYSFILHQGANASDIKMKFSKSSVISLLPAGNLEIKSEIGSLIDYHPAAFIRNENSTILKCSYISNNNTVAFNLGEYPKDKEVIIDPWIADPNYISLDKAFDVDYDTSGNVFIYGDNPPYLLKKYDKNGNLLWTYTLSLLGFQFGDFTVVKNANLIYVALGHANYGAGIVKLNESGVQQAQIVSNQFSEIWRINYSSCINKIIVGTPNQYGYSNIQLVDTSLTTINMGNQVTTIYNTSDIHCLALDSIGNCYVIDDNGVNKNGIYNSQLIKLPLPNLYPISYCVPSEYNWKELYTNFYYYCLVSNESVLN
jgi:hypothetical protein